MIASLRAWRASSGVISGVGLASANTIGRLAMPLSICPVTIPPTDSPTNTSASLSASASVEQRDGERVAEGLFDVEAVGGADVFEVDPADGRFKQSTEPDHVLRLLRADLEIEHVDIRERLEEDPLALHDRFARQGTDVPEAEHRRPVGDDGHQVAFRRIGVCVPRSGRDLAARLRHPRRIGEGQVSLILEGLGRGDLDLPGATLRVVIQGLLTADRHRWHKSFFVKELCYLSRSLLSSITKLIMCWNSWVNVLGSTLFPVRCARPSGVVAAAGGACDERPRHDV